MKAPTAHLIAKAKRSRAQIKKETTVKVAAPVRRPLTSMPPGGQGQL